MLFAVFIFSCLFFLPVFMVASIFAYWNTVFIIGFFFYFPIRMVFCHFPLYSTLLIPKLSHLYRAVRIIPNSITN